MSHLHVSKKGVTCRRLSHELALGWRRMSTESCCAQFLEIKPAETVIQRLLAINNHNQTCWKLSLPLSLAVCFPFRLQHLERKKKKKEKHNKKTDLGQDELLHWFVPHSVHQRASADGTEAGCDHRLLWGMCGQLSFSHQGENKVKKSTGEVVKSSSCRLQAAAAAVQQLPPGPAGRVWLSRCRAARATCCWEIRPAGWWPPGGAPWNPGRRWTRRRGWAATGPRPSPSPSLHPGPLLEQREHENEVIQSNNNQDANNHLFHSACCRSAHFKQARRATAICGTLTFFNLLRQWKKQC